MHAATPGHYAARTIAVQLSLGAFLFSLVPYNSLAYMPVFEFVLTGTQSPFLQGFQA